MVVKLTRQAIKPEAPAFALPAALAVGSGLAFNGLVEEAVPLLDEEANVHAELGLELDDALLGKDVRHDLAFASVLVAIACVEDTTADGDKCIVEHGLEGAVAMGVDECECVGLGNRDVIGRKADKGT